MTTRLTYPAPARVHLCNKAWVQQEKGKRKLVITSFTSAWTLADVMSAQSAGMYFVRGRHDFATADAAVKAGCGSRGETDNSAPTGGLRKWLKQLSSKQLAELVRVLDKGENA